MKVRFVSYNIHGGKGTDGVRDYARIGELLKSQRFDIALIQEFDTRCVPQNAEGPLKDLKTDWFSYASLAPTLKKDVCWYGNLVLSRFPIQQERTLDVSIPGREPRNILEVFVQTPLGPLQVINTHKGLSPLERGHQLRQLYNMLSKNSDIPLIVGGDINEWQFYSRALKLLDQALHPLPTGASFPTRLPIFRLDRLWCRPSSLFCASEVLKTSETRLYSDHYPVFAEIDLQDFNYSAIV